MTVKAAVDNVKRNRKSMELARAKVLRYWPQDGEKFLEINSAQGWTKAAGRLAKEVTDYHVAMTYVVRAVCDRLNTIRKGVSMTLTPGLTDLQAAIHYATSESKPAPLTAEELGHIGLQTNELGLLEVYGSRQPQSVEDAPHFEVEPLKEPPQLSASLLKFGEDDLESQISQEETSNRDKKIDSNGGSARLSRNLLPVLQNPSTSHSELIVQNQRDSVTRPSATATTSIGGSSRPDITTARVPLVTTARPPLVTPNSQPTAKNEATAVAGPSAAPRRIRFIVKEPSTSDPKHSVQNETAVAKSPITIPRIHLTLKPQEHPRDQARTSAEGVSGARGRLGFSDFLSTQTSLRNKQLQHSQPRADVRKGSKELGAEVGAKSGVHQRSFAPDPSESTVRGGYTLPQVSQNPVVASTSVTALGARPGVHHEIIQPLQASQNPPHTGFAEASATPVTTAASGVVRRDETSEGSQTQEGSKTVPNAPSVPIAVTTSTNRQELVPLTSAVPSTVNAGDSFIEYEEKAEALLHDLIDRLGVSCDDIDNSISSLGFAEIPGLFSWWHQPISVDDYPEIKRLFGQSSVSLTNLVFKEMEICDFGSISQMQLGYQCARLELFQHLTTSDSLLWLLNILYRRDGQRKLLASVQPVQKLPTSIFRLENYTPTDMTRITRQPGASEVNVEVSLTGTLHHNVTSLQTTAHSKCHGQGSKRSFLPGWVPPMASYLHGMSPLSDAILGNRPYDDIAVKTEITILLGKNRDWAWNHILQNRNLARIQAFRLFNMWLHTRTIVYGMGPTSRNGNGAKGKQPAGDNNNRKREGSPLEQPVKKRRRI